MFAILFFAETFPYPEKIVAPFSTEVETEAWLKKNKWLPTEGTPENVWKKIDEHTDLILLCEVIPMEQPS